VATNLLDSRNLLLAAATAGVLAASNYASAQFTCFGLPDNDPAVCSGHGVCIADESCQCLLGYSGQQCETTSCSGVPSNDPSVCSGHGVCIALDTCSCDATHAGDNCEFLASEVPTVSSWGVVALGLIILAAGTLLVRRRNDATRRA